MQESCRVQGWKAPESVVEAVVLAAELLADTVVVSSPGTVNVADPRIEGLMGQLARTKAEVISSSTKLSNLEEAHDKAKLEYEERSKKVQS